MIREECLEDILIAKKYLDEFHLLADERKTVLECCYYPPYHYKAFFAQIFKEKNYYQINCAYTFYADSWGLKSLSQSFRETEKNNLHPGKKGDVICKTFIPTQELVSRLISAAKPYNEPDPPKGYILDGESAFIQLFSSGNAVMELLFHNTPENIFDLLRMLSDEI